MAKTKKQNTARVSLSEKTLTSLVELAKKEKRSISQMIRVIIEERIGR